jgi:hypothetical protein
MEATEILWLRIDRETTIGKSLKLRSLFAISVDWILEVPRCEAREPGFPEPVAPEMTAEAVGNHSQQVVHSAPVIRTGSAKREQFPL